VTPLVEVLLIPADAASYLRGCSMLLVVGLQLLTLRQLVQVRHDITWGSMFGAVPAVRSDSCCACDFDVRQQAMLLCWAGVPRVEQ
jgi:hypothetical protein